MLKEEVVQQGLREHKEPQREHKVLKEEVVQQELRGHKELQREHKVLLEELDHKEPKVVVELQELVETKELKDQQVLKVLLVEPQGRQEDKVPKDR